MRKLQNVIQIQEMEVIAVTSCTVTEAMRNLHNFIQVQEVEIIAVTSCTVTEAMRNLHNFIQVQEMEMELVAVTSCTVTEAAQENTVARASVRGAYLLGRILFTAAARTARKKSGLQRSNQRRALRHRMALFTAD